MGFIFLLLSIIPSYAATSRTLSLDEADVGIIHTSLGYSTVLQFDSRPTSVVVGDQDAYKVEYIGDSLTIKPLIPIARTNLFVFTNYDRYNFQLENGKSADYTIKVKRKFVATARMADTNDLPNNKLVEKLQLQDGCGPITLFLDSLARSGSFLIAHFRLYLSNKVKPLKGFKFTAGDFDFRQNGKSLPIDNFYLSKAYLTRETPISGVATIQDVKNTPLVFTFSPDALANNVKCKALTIQVFKLPK